MSTDFVEIARPGDWVDSIGALPDDHDLYPTRIPTDRYTSAEFQRREREAIWMRVWQIAGRVDDLPKAGDWKVYQIFDQSFIVVRGKDEKLRAMAAGSAPSRQISRTCSSVNKHSTTSACAAAAVTSATALAPSVSRSLRFSALRPRARTS